MKSTLSVIIITKNEEKNIRECLETVKWADEIVVIDEGSKDNTAKICQEYSNLKFYTHKMEKGFGPQKNYALSKTMGKWVLSIDADERVTPELKEEILGEIAKDKFDGYCLRRSNLIFGKPLLDYKPLALRLFKRGKGKFTDKMVHESVKVKGKVGKLKNYFLHYPKSFLNFQNYIDIYLNHYTSLTAEDLYQMGRRVRPKNYLLYFVLKPSFIFLQKFFLKKDYRNGLRGLFLSLFSAIACLISYAKLWKKMKKSNRYSILYLHNGVKISGGERSLLNLWRNLDREKF
ncbi:MAG: glycosyltransferase family 2 protein, partial [Halanaerobiales bacterium]|nr:glycosyltransferase family 2 protein [Halanaerobiales bacterium]